MSTSALSTRRSFIQTAGAALSVPLVAASASVDAAEEPNPLAARLAHLEDLNAIRALNHQLARHLTAGTGDPIAAVFADPANARINPEVRGLVPDGFGDLDTIDIAPDRQVATAVLHYTVHVETPIGPDCPLVEMARQQGGGIVRRTEHRVFEHAYVRRDGIWKIQRSACRLP